ncbi:vitamin K epoxide reductase family protein [Auraticoccus cholistanensis]|nr:vitamin K epoxide reductase family protein [Auraticoccus cholistanensis]
MTTTAQGTSGDELDEDLDGPDAPEDEMSRRWGVLLVVTSALGFLAAMVLTVDRFHLLADPEAQFVCDINPFVACGPVMSSAAGALFGFPNPLLGIGGFAVTGTLGVVVASGLRLPRWVLVCLQVAVLAAAAFITWLQFQSLHVINALCLWCMLVWLVTIPLVVTTTVTTLRTGALGAGAQRVGRALRDWQWVLVLAWYVVVATAVVLRFYREFARFYFGITL